MTLVTNLNNCTSTLDALMPSPYPFLMATKTTTTTETTTRTITDSIELATYKNGSTEVYTIDADGRSTFAGYYEAVCLTPLAESVHPLIAGHQAAHRDFWATYLPGAATWLRAA